MNHLFSVFVLGLAWSNVLGSSSLKPSVGLVNLGNTCYLNAQLQSAFHIPAIRNVINSNEGSNAGVNSLGRVFKDMERSSMHAASTDPICRTFGISPMIQQDSQEFWKLLLPELQLPELLDLYQGAYESYIVALDGTKREKRREEAFLDLSLEVDSGDVMGALEGAFGAPELLSVKEGNGWRPEKGADKVDALKGSCLKVQGLPSLLQLHLKRFQYNWQTDTMSKLNNRFAFPKELDLSDVCGDAKGMEKNAIYDLLSIVIHVGEYGAGHYYAYIRPDVNKNEWFCFDDQLVKKVTYDEVVADAFGGAVEGKVANLGFFGRLFKVRSYGRGGQRSSAYVLQYAKRCDIPKLFGTRRLRG